METSDIYFVTLKLSDTYGPGDTRRKIFYLWTELASGEKTFDMSRGNQMIDIVHVDDVVDGYIKTIALVTRDAKREFCG